MTIKTGGYGTGYTALAWSPVACGREGEIAVRCVTVWVCMVCVCVGLYGLCVCGVRWSAKVASLCTHISSHKTSLITSSPFLSLPPSLSPSLPLSLSPSSLSPSFTKVDLCHFRFQSPIPQFRPLWNHLSGNHGNNNASCLHHLAKYPSIHLITRQSLNNYR